ncbi:hypothetical protein CFter6_3458 [Collimonas fungivorans]|uniref:Uncharacterized protein n=1 Tax=Collimonas fungivorans TaxID=158899 RepID=A0A127PFA2_9BURK|nr:hypothetical protein CFter6_3458 [Collimonas fungivorans]
MSLPGLFVTQRTDRGEIVRYRIFIFRWKQHWSQVLLLEYHPVQRSHFFGRILLNAFS